MMSVDSVGAVLLISDDAAGLAAFYRDALALPLEDELHEGVPLHYGCELGSVHFAIHPSADWPGERSADGQSPVIVLHTSDVQRAYERLVANGVAATPPWDHGFAIGTAFRDPDGNNVQVMQPAH
jgi:predicted enzyme related to lactoylglutathione lyase